ncbi:MAG TPA: NEW3 domain-containing protein, partial [Ilumatobacter sp.]
MLLFATMLVATLVIATPAAGAQGTGVTITTPYPSVAAQPGSSIEFDLAVLAPVPELVALSVAELPSGWNATLRGGGFVIAAITAGTAADEPAEAQLEIRIPPEAQPGTYPVIVRATGSSGVSDLRLQLDVQRDVDTGIAVTADFPSLRGDPTSTFTYTLTIANNTPSEQTFTFAPRGPQGWDVTASPTAQAQANTVTIAAGETAQVKVEAKPPATAPQDQYPIVVEVTSATGGSGAIDLIAEVTGTPMLEFATADQRLNVSGQANQTKRIPMLLANSGTAPLTDVKLAATAPKDWEISFEPTEIEEVKPNETAQVVAVVKPAAGAVAGDYMLTARASAGSNSSNVELRYTVEGSRALGVVGVGVIVIAV